jgi:hypothetical protein
MSSIFNTQRGCYCYHPSSGLYLDVGLNSIHRLTSLEAIFSISSYRYNYVDAKLVQLLVTDHWEAGLFACYLAQMRL